CEPEGRAFRAERRAGPPNGSIAAPSPYRRPAAINVLSRVSRYWHHGISRQQGGRLRTPPLPQRTAKVAGRTNNEITLDNFDKTRI
ncbi:MAG: hypothetical protein ACRD2G_17800, partial [Terriglobia bacterium]